jgi:signal transduction histidine kinase
VKSLAHGFDVFIRRRSLWWLLILFWALVTAASYLWRLDELEDHAHAMASQRGRLVFEMVEITRLWASQHGGVYAPVTATTPPNPYLDVPEKVIESPSGRQLTKINPAYMTRQLGELIARERDLRIHLTSLKPINPGNMPDAWERETLTQFESSRRERISIVDAETTAMFRYMAPLEVKASCMACHAKQGYQVGDVRGGISVTFPAAYVLDIINAQKRGYLVIHLVAFGLMAALGWSSLSLIRSHVLALEATRGELVESEKMASLGRMVAGFAHEVNTPVGVAVGAVSQAREASAELGRLIAREEVTEEELHAQLALLDETSQLALANLKRAAGMVHSFKRTAVDQTSEAARDFDLAELIDDVVKSLHNAFKSTPVRITVDCPPGLKLYGAAGALEQILNNLLNNSRMHAFADGTQAGAIRIQAHTEHDNVVIDYSDNGAGMDEESLTHAFEPFYTTRRGSGGSGLGLYIVYNLATRVLGGTINATSSTNATSMSGQGCRFIITFPRHSMPGKVTSA